MHLQLITLRGIRLDKEMYELMVPTADGEIAVFPGHEPLVTLAVPGALTVRYDKKTPMTSWSTLRLVVVWWKLIPMRFGYWWTKLTMVPRFQKLK